MCKRKPSIEYGYPVIDIYLYHVFETSTLKVLTQHIKFRRCLQKQTPHSIRTQHAFSKITRINLIQSTLFNCLIHKIPYNSGAKHDQTKEIKIRTKQQTLLYVEHVAESPTLSSHSKTTNGQASFGQLFMKANLFSQKVPRNSSQFKVTCKKLENSGTSQLRDP